MKNKTIMQPVTHFNKNEHYQIYCSDGPVKGLYTAVVINSRKCLIPLTTDPFYKAAIYLVSTARNDSGRYIAVFSHCIKR